MNKILPIAAVCLSMVLVVGAVSPAMAQVTPIKGLEGQCPPKQSGFKMVNYREDPIPKGELRDAIQTDNKNGVRDNHVCLKVIDPNPKVKGDEKYVWIDNVVKDKRLKK